MAEKGQLMDKHERLIAALNGRPPHKEKPCPQCSKTIGIVYAGKIHVFSKRGRMLSKRHHLYYWTCACGYQEEAT